MYYLHRNKNYGWFIENLQYTKSGSKKALDKLLSKTFPELLNEFGGQMDYVDVSVLSF